MFATLFFYLFVIAAIVQCGYALFFFKRIYSIPVGAALTPSRQHHPVSIVICAKNEAANLKKNLPLILSQRYSNEAGIPLYEVIVVNDASTDNTEEVLKELELRYDHLWDVSIGKNAPRDMPGKKFALSKGIAYASNDRLLLTDADCTPASDNWLALMTAPLANNKEIVAGYGAYNPTDGLLNAFTRWETMHTFLQYSSYSLAGKPYMAVGRNLATTKQALLKAQAADIWKAVPSGDDDLLVNISGNAVNTAVVAERAAFTFTDAKNSFKDWVAQKQRHFSTAKYYKSSIKLLLGLYGCSHAALWICFFITLFSPFRDQVLTIMAVRSVACWGIWSIASAKLGEKKLLFLFPAFDLAWLVYNFAFFPYITWKNKKQWK